MKRISLPLIIMLIATGVVVAAPSLYVTKEDPAAVEPTTSWTGPDQDPHAIDGQWFYSPSLQSEVAVPKEFHDSFSCCPQPASTDGCCSTEGSSIQGYVTSLQMNMYGNITGFTMRSTITNDTSENDPGCTNLLGYNALGESRSSVETSFGTMLYPVMTVEFAMIDPAYQDIPVADGLQDAGCNLPPAYIVADDYDVAAWYGKTVPGDCCPTGAYCVPGWIMTDELAQGESATVDMSFHVTGSGICQEDLRWWMLWGSNEYGLDILSNRTESLKISCWIEGIGIDLNGRCWDDIKGELQCCLLEKYSTCSVFHDPDGDIPEPATILLLGIGGLAIRKFRKKA